MRRLLTTAILLLGALPCLFADGKPAVELQAFSPAEVKPGNAAQYTIILKNMSPKISLDKVPIPSGLRYVGSSQSNQTSIINGQVSRQISLTLSFAAEAEGSYTIDSWNISFEGKNYEVPAATLKVDKNAPDAPSGNAAGGFGMMSGFGGGMPSIAQMMSGFGSRRAAASAAAQQRAAQNAETSLDGKIHLELKLPRERLYVGETVPVELVFSFDKSLLLSRIIPTQIIPHIKNLNEFNCPGFKGEPVVEKDLDPEKVTITYSTAITPLKVGKYKLDFEVQGVFTREISLDDMMNMSFFERMNLGSGVSIPFKKTLDNKTAEILPLPAQGRPANYAGAIGKFSILRAKIDPVSTAAGDPCTFTVQVSGIGNFDRITPPPLAENPQWKFYTPKTAGFADDSQNLGYAGTKTFEYVVVPNSPDIKKAPVFEMSYFDPDTQKYETIKTPDIGITVSPRSATPGTTSAPAAPVAANKASTAPITTVGNITQSAGKADTSREEWRVDSAKFIVLQLLILAAFAAWAGWKIRANKLSSDEAYARRVRAKRSLAKALKAANSAASGGNAGEFFVSSRRALQSVLSGMSEYETGAITLREAYDILSEKNLSDAEKDALRTYFDGADALAFGNFDTKDLNLAKLNDGLRKLVTVLQK